MGFQALIFLTADTVTMTNTENIPMDIITIIIRMVSTVKIQTMN